MNESIADRAATWCQPISESSFSGELSRFDEEYEELLAEIKKLESVAGRPCDWDLVYKRADSVLRTKTKNMVALGALCIALLKRERYTGLAAGLGAYSRLIESHSEDLFPRPDRRRGRAGAYTWLSQHLAKGIEQIDPRSEEHEALLFCLHAFERLDDLLREQLLDMHPAVESIKLALSRFIEVTKPTPLPEIDPKAAEPAPESVPDLTPEPEREPNPDLAHQSAPPSEPDPVQSHESPVDPVSEISPLPQPPPLMVDIHSLAAIGSEEQAADILQAIAPVLRQLSRFYVERGERSAIGYHLARAASLLPVVPEENNDTAAWKDRVEAIAPEPPGAILNGPSPSRNVTAATNDQERLDQVIASARERAAGQGLDEACELIQEELKTVSAKPLRFRLRLALVSFFVEGQAAELARPILQDLYHELEDPIHTWEPKLLAEVAASLLASNRQLEQHFGQDLEPDLKQELKQESAKMITLLSRLDPQAALRTRNRK